MGTISTSLARRLSICLIVSVAFQIVAPRPFAQERDVCAESADLSRLISCEQKSEPQRAARCSKPRSERLIAPVEGVVTMHFGQSTEYGVKSRGLVFKTAVGATIRAPLSGVIAFAGGWRSYGDLLIVDGCNTVTILAGDLSIMAKPGEAVKRGATLASTREPQTGEPLLYLEVRARGLAVDPAPAMEERN